MNIIERLRTRKAFWLNGGVWMLGTEPDADCMEAADEIERLREEVRNLTNLLDGQVGTPCEQIRHEQEIERLTEMCQNREEFIAERGLWKEFGAWLAVPWPKTPLGDHKAVAQRVSRSRKTRHRSKKAPAVDDDDAPEWTKDMFERADLYHGDKLIRRGRPPATNPKQALKRAAKRARTQIISR